MEIYPIILILIPAYLLGSIPTAVWVGVRLHGIDVREHGSGNAGATNTIRVLGWKTGVPVLLADIAKGTLAALLPALFSSAAGFSPEAVINMKIVAGLTAVAGHIFPVFARFRGGKGVATTFGFVLAVAPLPTLLCLVLFLIVLFATGYVSLSSMSAGLLFPILNFTIFDTPTTFYTIFSVVIGIAILASHHQNIGRLIRGEERRFLKSRN